MLRLVCAALLGLLTAPGALAEAPADDAVAAAPLVYEVDYEAEFVPGESVVAVAITVRQPRDLLRQLRFRIDARRYRAMSADGELDVDDGRVTWRPPATGGTLRYQWLPDHQRGGGGYDSRMTDEWAIFRGDDLLPPAAALAVKGARSKSRLRLAGPPGWTFVSAYPKSAEDDAWFEIAHPDRRLDRPVGWMAAGQLAVRRDTVAGRRLALASPAGQGLRHMDMIAFLRWNLPALVKVFPDFPDRFLIVSAENPMWRGGLSGPDSLYIHSDRPLISGNGTSTLLHELVHVAQGYAAENGGDWIVEAIAEYYTLEILRRTGTISQRRYDMGLEKLREWAAETDGLHAEASSGARTARGVLVMVELDAELRERTDGKRRLDDVARRLSRQQETVSIESLRAAAESVAGGPVKALADKNLR